MKIILSVFLFSLLILISCGGNNTENKSSDKVKSGGNNDPIKDTGIGPVKSIELVAVNEEMAAKGKELFKVNCSACHKMKKRYVGPSMLGVTERRTPEWIMNMIMNPELMIAENDVAKALLAEYLAPMANQNISEPDARAILEYFRLKDIGKKENK